MSGGLSVALCLSEGLLYLKSMQNGNPMFMAYKITPYDNNSNSNQNINSNSTSSNQQDVLNALVTEFQKQREKINNLENEIGELKKSNSGGKINELI